MERWDSPALRVKNDSRWRARYRLLQSWYREQVLELPPGPVRRSGRIVGNLLTDEDVGANPAANFLTPGISEYVAQRVPEVQAEQGTLDEDRLYRNLLSSMPLCFNLFGELRSHPAAAARALSALLDIDIHTVERVEVEWAPPADAHLGDRTAFDAFVAYRTTEGKRGFLGVETKYTEPFSPEEYDRPEYRRLTDDPASGFRPGASDVLKGRLTNQLWRNALLALSLRNTDEFDEGYCVVAACGSDAGLERAITDFYAQRVEPGTLVKRIAFEDVVAACRDEPELAEWAAAFERRYVDLSPVEAAGS